MQVSTMLAQSNTACRCSTLTILRDRVGKNDLGIKESMESAPPANLRRNFSTTFAKMIMVATVAFIGIARYRLDSGAAGAEAVGEHGAGNILLGSNTMLTNNELTEGVVMTSSADERKMQQLRASVPNQGIVEDRIGEIAFPDNYFVIKPEDNDNMCLDMHLDIAGGQNAYFYKCHDGPNQIWTYNQFTKQIGSLMNEECLEVRTDKSNNLCVRKCHGGQNQRFYRTGDAWGMAL